MNNPPGHAYMKKRQRRMILEAVDGWSEQLAYIAECDRKYGDCEGSQRNEELANEFAELHDELTRRWYKA